MPSICFSWAAGNDEAEVRDLCELYPSLYQLFYLLGLFRRYVGYTTKRWRAPGSMRAQMSCCENYCGKLTAPP